VPFYAKFFCIKYVEIFVVTKTKEQISNFQAEFGRFFSTGYLSFIPDYQRRKHWRKINTKTVAIFIVT
jgi:hypothetical protein